MDIELAEEVVDNWEFEYIAFAPGVPFALEAYTEEHYE